MTGNYFEFNDFSGATQTVHDDFLSGRAELLLQELQANDLYPEVEAPVFRNPGGVVEQGFRLSMQANAGAIYFTTDDSDPLLADGSISPSAQLFRSAVALEENTVVKARALDGKEWRRADEWNVSHSRRHSAAYHRDNVSPTTRRPEQPVR